MRVSLVTINQGLLEKMADHLSIVHHTPGRIRLRVSLKFALEPQATQNEVRDFLDKLKNAPVVRDVKVNMIIGSITIQYDSTQFDSSLWEAWLKKERLDEVLALVQKFIQQ